VTTRDNAMAIIREQSAAQQREIAELKAQASRVSEQHAEEINAIYQVNEQRSANARENLRVAQTKARHVEYVAKVAQQLSRLTHLELDFEAIGGGNNYIVTSDGFSATVDAESYNITIGNPAVRLKVRTFSLDGSGLNDTAIIMIAGLFGIRPTPRNTPKHTHGELFDLDPESSAPSGVLHMLGRLGLGYIDIG
jgi:hypothetical protein